MARSSFRDFLNGYETPGSEGNGSVTGRRFFCRSFSGTVTPAMLHRSRRGILSVFSLLNKKIQYITAKAYGAMSLAFGLVTIILSFLEDYGSATGEAATISFIIGVGFALLSIPLLLTEGALSLLIQNFRPADKVLFEFLCINRAQRNENVKPIHISVTAVVGALLGFMGYFVPVWWVLAAVLCVLLIYIAAGSPEFSMLITLLALPYIGLMPRSQTVIVCAVVLSLLSFIRKVLSGKRVFSFEQYDLLVLLICTAVLISGLFTGGRESLISCSLTAVLTLGYFLASNLITNRRLADSMLASVVLSSVPATVYTYVLLISAASRGELLSAVSEGVRSVFESCGTYAVFLLVALFLGMALVRQSRGLTRFFFAGITVLNFGALVATGEYFALIALALGVCVYYALKLRNIWSCVITLAAFAVPYVLIAALLFLSPSSSLVFSGNGSAAEYVAAVREALGEILRHPMLGLGVIGAPIEGASSNIFVDICLGTGIISALIFITALIVRQRHRTVYHKYIKDSEISILSPAVAAATLAAICFGAVFNVWADIYSYYLFWCLFGLGSATLRVAKKEYDDRILYFEDTIDRESSVVDVSIV